MKRPRIVSKAPLAVAGIVCAPLFFSALMAASLAVESPVEVASIIRGGTTIFKFAEPTAWNEASIWLLALAATSLVAVAGVVGMYFRHGIFLTCLAGVVVPLAVTWRVEEWRRHHTERFPYGVDLVRDQIDGLTNPSDLVLASEWEASAKETALQLAWVAIGIAVAAVAVAAYLGLRRRRGARPVPVNP